MKRLMRASAALCLFLAAAFAQPAPLSVPVDRLNCTVLTSYLVANLPAAPVVDIGTFDPGNSAAYIKALNLRQAIYEVYGGANPDPVLGANQYAVQQFGHFCNEWQQHGRSQSAIPSWPVLMYVSVPDFDSWWAAFNLRYDTTSVFYGDDKYSDSLARNQYFKKVAAPLPAVVVTSATAPSGPVVSSNPVGPPIAGTPFFSVTTGASSYSVGQKDPSGKYVLVNPSPMNSDPAKYWWVPVN